MKRQPNSKHCFICGLENPAGLHLKFYTEDDETVVSMVTVPEQYQGYPGVVHGGIVAAMLDEAAGRAHMSGDPPRFLYTAKLDLRYRKNTPVGRPLKLVGKVGKIKERTATASAFLYDEDGTLLAEADALLVDMPEEAVRRVNLEELGWKVYED
jgi:uncharacterized protein (TIGR00369 family)